MNKPFAALAATGLNALFRAAALTMCLLLLAGCGNREEPAAGTNASGAASDTTGATTPADLLLVNAYVYTVDPRRTVAQAVAVTDGVISAVGSTADLESLRGPDTRVMDLGGRMLLPGLHDVHMHMFGIVEPDECTFRSEPMSLEEMVPHLQECIQHYQLPPGQWLKVEMWNFSDGNQISNMLPSLRAALDAVSTEHPIILWGNDGHHGAVNSMALQRARDPQGNVVGLSAATLATVFKDYTDVVGVDADGEPNGELNENARNLLDTGPRRDPAKLGGLLPAIGQELARNGITSIRDASLGAGYLPFLKEFDASGQMRFRLQIANRLTPADYRDALSGEINIDQMMTELEANRAAFAESRLIKADSAKIFADGVLEGNPYADPPSLPNGAVLEAYKQPRFHFDQEKGTVEVVGYVDTASPLCVETRANAERYQNDPQARDAFSAENGFHPAQCNLSFGVLADPEPFIMEYVRRLDAAGFNIHIHAIGDRAVRVATNALEQVVKPGSDNPLRHGMAHLQLVHPDDQKRIGQMGLYLAWTYAWILVNPAYDLTVIPFINDVSGPNGIYDPASYYMQNTYPVRSMMEAGAVTAAGSDAPVEARSPRPFINMAYGVTRQGANGQVLNAEQTIDIHEMLAAYTINGARALAQENLTGSIEVGKKADLAVLDRNVVELYESGNGMGIAETQVDLTFFEGELIYERALRALGSE